MDRVERPQRCGERVSGSAKHCGGHVDAVHALEEAKHQPAAIGQILWIEQPLSKAPIQRAQAFDLRERARDSLLDRRLLGQPIGLEQHDAEENGRVDVRDHNRSARSSRS